MTVKRRTNYYTVKELAYFCGVNEATVRRWIHEGKLKAVWCSDLYNVGYRGGNGLVIPINELTDFDPIDNAAQLGQLNRSSDMQASSEYIDWLERRSEQLYEEIEFIEKMKEYVRRNEPYL